LGALACGDDDGTAPADEGQLVVTASAGLSAAAASGASRAGTPVGDPASWLVGLYSFHISENANCAPPFVTVFDNGGTARVFDFTSDPELFRTGGVPIGTYPCVAMKISDILDFESSVTAGACVAGTTYRGDIYREGGEDEPFRDLDLNPIPATGSDAVPSEDGVFIFFSTDKAGAGSRGLADNQVVPLVSPLVIPDEITFSWDASNAVVDDVTRCLLEPDAPALFS
jgi:hypothetical protein